MKYFLTFRNTFLVVAIISLLCCIATAQTRHNSDSTKALPKLVIDSLEFDSGLMKEGDKVIHSFKIKNEGQSNLEILSVSPSCGCTASSFDKVIAPGQEGKITLSVAASERGAFTKTADVVTNDPQQKQLTLSLRYVVETANPLPRGRRVGWFVISPTDVLRGRAKQGHSFATSATVYTAVPQAVRITKVIPNGDAFTVKLETVEEGKRYVISARSNTSLQPGEYKQTIKLITDNSDYPDLEIDLQVTVMADLDAKPGKK